MTGGNLFVNFVFFVCFHFTVFRLISWYTTDSERWWVNSQFVLQQLSLWKWIAWIWLIKALISLNLFGVVNIVNSKHVERRCKECVLIRKVEFRYCLTFCNESIGTHRFIKVHWMSSYWLWLVKAFD
jgi:hypothetical protein